MSGGQSLVLFVRSADPSRIRGLCAIHMGLILLSGVPLSSLGENIGGEPSGLTGDKSAAAYDRSNGAASMGLDDEKIQHTEMTRTKATGRGRQCCISVRRREVLGLPKDYQKPPQN